MALSSLELFSARASSFEFRIVLSSMLSGLPGLRGARGVLPQECAQTSALRITHLTDNPQMIDDRAERWIFFDARDALAGLSRKTLDAPAALTARVPAAPTTDCPA